MQPKFTLKCGDTLAADCIHRDDQGVPINLVDAGLTIVSTVASPDGSIKYPLAVGIDDQAINPGGFTIEADTSDWEPGYGLQWDIRYVAADGTSFSTTTIFFTLNPAIS